ncbi:sensor domain-containing diguanylate cyclase [Sulfurimonas sp.]
MTHLPQEAFNYKILFESTGTGIAVIEANGDVSLVNTRLIELLGEDTSKIIGNSFLKWIYKDDTIMMQEYHKNRLLGLKNIPENYEFRIMKQNGEISWVLVNLVFLPSTSQTLASLINITKLKKTEYALKEAITAQHAILAAIPDLMFELDSQGYYLNVWVNNPKELAARKEHLLGKTVLKVLPELAANEIMLALADAKRAHQSFGRQIYIDTTEGKLWFELSVSIKPNENSADTFIVLSHNITDTKKLELKLLHLSNYDYLTNLYNRRMLIEQLEKDMHRAIRYELPLSICMLDIDYFKNINDTHGHSVGDTVLVKMSQLLLETLREIDYSGRYGGEEFIIVLPETSIVRAKELAERLRDKIEHMTITLQDETQFNFTVSIGVASLNKELNSVDKLIKVADSAMYLAKNAGRNRIMCASE